MKKLVAASMLCGMLLAACESSAIYATETNIVGQSTFDEVHVVVTQQYLSTEGLFGEDLDSGVEFIARATNNNPYKICASLRFVLSNIEGRAAKLEHNRGYFLEPGQSKNIAYARFPGDTWLDQYKLQRSSSWKMDADNQYCIPTI